jgi:hypothetical protein
MENIEVDVEKPHREIETLQWLEAASRYSLDESDLEALKNGKVVWAGQTAITLHEEES